MLPLFGRRSRQLSTHQTALEQLTQHAQALEKQVIALRLEVQQLSNAVGLVREKADGTQEQFIAFRARVTGRWRRGNDPEAADNLPLDDPRVSREEAKRRLKAAGKL